MVELSDEHGMTGDRAVEVTRVRIKFGKRYNVSVRCQSNHVGELKIPVVVNFYYDALSKEDEMGIMESTMVIELVVRTKLTMADVLKKKVSTATGKSLLLENTGKGSPRWECSSCMLQYVPFSMLQMILFVCCTTTLRNTYPLLEEVFL